MPPPPSAKLTVLVTNLVLAHRSGTEVVVEELADGLRRAGHRPMVYASALGAQAEAMRTRGHVVVDRLASVPWRPDVIHGHHTPTAMAAMLAFPDVPALFVCHDAVAAHDTPPLHPSVRRWFAVSELLRARLAAQGVPADRIGVLGNVVDLERYRPRGPAPERPARALALTKTASVLPVLRAVCDARGLLLDELGPAVGRVTDRLAETLPAYDLVFASGRMALEAACAGCGVVVCDGRGLAGLLTGATAEAWLPWNLGSGILVHDVTESGIARALDAWEPAGVAAATQRIRARASLSARVGELEAIYAGMLAEPAPDPTAGAAAAAAFVEDWVPALDPSRPWARLVRDMGHAELFGRPPLDLWGERLEQAIGASRGEAVAYREAAGTQRAALDGHLAAVGAALAQGVNALSSRVEDVRAEVRGVSSAVVEAAVTLADAQASGIRALERRLRREPGGGGRLARGLYRRLLRGPVRRWRARLRGFAGN